MSLTSIRVYPDWQARLWRSQAQDRNIWNVALATFALSVLLLFVNRVARLEQAPRSLLADGVVNALYLTTGLILLARRIHPRRRRLAGACLLVMVGVLLGESLLPQIDEDATHRTPFFVFSAVQGILLVIPGWCILALVSLRRGEERRLDQTGARLLRGLVAGGVIVVLMYLSRSFAGMQAVAALPLTPLWIQRVAFAVGMQSVAEELFFRGMIFRYLYMRREMGFWTATSITLLLNLVVYAIQIPSILSPLGVALRLTAACTMIVVNTELYSREASLIGPAVSNGMFQISLFAMGLA